MPGGATTQVQFNDAGAFAGDTALLLNKINGQLEVVWKSGGYGTGGLKLRDAVNGGVVVLQPLTGNSLYITNAAGSPVPLTLGAWGNPNDGTMFEANYQYWRITSGRFNVGNSAPHVAQVNVAVSTPTNLGQVIQLAASQTADALQVTNNSGTALAKIDKDGGIYSGSQQLRPWVQLTQAAYDALGTKDPNTLYVIVG